MMALLPEYSQNGPLAGLKVLEFGAVTPPSIAAMLMSGWGADVIRIDRRDHEADTSANTLCRGRRSVVLDLKKPAGKDVARRLVAQAVILIMPRFSLSRGIVVWPAYGGRSLRFLGLMSWCHRRL